MVSLMNYTKYFKKNQYKFFITSCQKMEERTHPQLNLWGQYYLNIKLKLPQQQQQKLETKISFKYSYKKIFNKIPENRAGKKMA